MLVHVFSSEAGVHQGDPLASTLVALASHPITIKVAEDDNVVITAYSDNIIMTGKMSVVRRAAVVCKELMATMNLKLNQTPRLPLLYPPARARLHPPTWPSPFHQPILTQSPYHRRTPSLLSPSPFQTALCSSSPPHTLSGTRASRRLERQMASERHRSNPLSSAHPALYPHFPPPAALATSLQTPDHWQQNPATSMETD